MVQTSTELIAGILFLVALVLSAEYIIRKSMRLSEATGFSGTFVGLTVLSIGTSLPELFTNVVASIEILTHDLTPEIGSALAVGTSIGSDTFQQTIVLGIVALLGTMAVSKEFIRRDIPLMIGTSILVLLFALDGTLSRWNGAVLFFGYLIYLYILYQRQREENMKHQVCMDVREVLADVFGIMVGLLFLIISARELLFIAKDIVTTSGIGASFLGVFVVGAASALPELSTALTAVRKKQYGTSVGILIGSNITNPAFVTGLGAMISGYILPNAVIFADMPAKIITGFFVYLFLRNLRLSKKEGFSLIAIYFIYLVLRMRYFPLDVFT